MADINERIGAQTLEEVMQACQDNCGQRPDERMMQSLQTASNSIYQALSNPENDKAGRTPLIEPRIGMPHGINPTSVLLFFMIVMYANPWLKDNAIIVCFGTGSGINLGVARLKDKEYWEGHQGKGHLQTTYIKTYTIEEYKDLVHAQFPK